MSADQGNTVVSFLQISQDLHRLSTNEKGRKFEEMCCWFLANAPEYCDKFNGIWQWKELGWGQDTGIDIVARRPNGELWAIQAKAHEVGRWIGRRDVDSFLAKSNTGCFTRRILMSTTDRLGRNARPALQQQQIPVDLVLYRNLCDSRVDWSVWQQSEWPVQNRKAPPPIPDAMRNSDLTITKILSWADQHKKETGKWPSRGTGQVRGAAEESWANIDAALGQGLRGLLGGSSLPRLLSDHRGVAHPHDRPNLTIEKILFWVDQHKERAKEWPTRDSDRIPSAPREEWANVDAMLSQGGRGLPGGSSLARLLSEFRGVPHRDDRPNLTEEQILSWADQHHAKTGDWPTSRSGEVLSSPLESWQAIDIALAKGRRGLAGGSSLPRLLEVHRQVRNKGNLPGFELAQVLSWAEAHHERTGKWPKLDSGPIAECPDETWGAVNSSLVAGKRGFSGSSSLAKLLNEHRGVRNHMSLPPFSIDEILQWADAHYERVKDWPTSNAGDIPERSGETWAKVNKALQEKLRGLQKAEFNSLAELLFAKCGVRYAGAARNLDEKEIVKWMQVYHDSKGDYPTKRSEPIGLPQGETWGTIDSALIRGLYSVGPNSSLAKLRYKYLGVGAQPKPHAEAQIILWAKAYKERTGAWPTRNSGEVQEARPTTWQAINMALRQGHRGLPGGSSLTNLLQGVSESG